MFAPGNENEKHQEIFEGQGREGGIVIVVIRIMKRIIVAKHIRTRAAKPGACMSCRIVPKARKAEKPKSQETSGLRLKTIFHACKIIR